MFLRLRIAWAWSRHARAVRRALWASEACLTPAEPLIQLYKHYRRKQAMKEAIERPVQERIRMRAAYRKSYSRLCSLLEKEMG